MDPDTISNLRLRNQCIAGSKFIKPAEIVSWLGALQAQDYAMSRWAIGLRLKNAMADLVQEAIDKGEVLRTHVLRPTWHIVPATDIRWMIELTAPGIRTSMGSRHRQLGLTASQIRKSQKVIARALTDEGHLTRSDLVAVLEKEKIRDEDNRAAHLLALAELDCLICSGASIRGKHTYALFDERVPKARSLSTEEAASRLARTYFSSHGPATLQDFAWWSGLSIRNARNALEEIAPEFNFESIEKETYWFKDQKGSDSRTDQVYLLPAYDEFLISYKSRSASVPPGKLGITISSNGIFKPIIVVDGKVAGIWRRTTKGRKVIIETEFFKKPGKDVLKKVEAEGKRFGEFLGMEVMVDD